MSGKAVEFPQGLAWLNSQPLAMADLAGRVVLLDFFTHGCVNCLHAERDLERLARRFGSFLAVIGVHSPKFKAERDRESVKKYLLRQRINHPVALDKDRKLMEELGIPAWPGQALLDVDGSLVATSVGENIEDALGEKIADLVASARARGENAPEPLAISIEDEASPGESLGYPGKVLAAGEDFLLISDSGNHRVILAEMDLPYLSAKATHIIGGQKGFADGDFATARFASPQGAAMAEEGRIFYLADAGNHAIRKIDLDARTVTTVAGTGERASLPITPGKATETPLSSPWDVALVQDRLFIAMSGSHQIFKLDFKTGFIGPHAGSGIEGLVDGPLRQAQFAQPASIDSDGARLFVADAESSSVRQVGLGPKDEVATLVGTGLFDFGDRDGECSDALLQHPRGIAWSDFDKLIYLADTYNHKIKRIDPETGTCVTYVGKGRGAMDGVAARFFEPSGVSVAGGWCLVADMGNHAIRVIDLSTARTEMLRLDLG